MPNSHLWERVYDEAEVELSHQERVRVQKDCDLYKYLYLRSSRKCREPGRSKKDKKLSCVVSGCQKRYHDIEGLLCHLEKGYVAHVV